MNLDKELIELARPKRTINEQQHQKQKIIERNQRTRTFQLSVQGAVMTCIAALFLILLFQTNQVNVPQTKQAMLTEELMEMTVLHNEVPERHLNLNSPMYILKRSTTDHNVLNTFQSLATAENIKVVHSSGQFLFQEYSNVYDILLKFKNGEQLYLKYSSNVLFDPVNEVLYELPSDSISEFYYLFQKLYSNTSNKWKFYALFSIGVLMLLEYYFIGKKFYNKDEDGKYKTRPGLMNALFFLLFSIPFLFGHYWIGTMHLGFVLSGLILSFLLGEFYDVKKGIKKPNWIWSAFTLIHVILLLFIIIL